jgi:phytoene desaturase
LNKICKGDSSQWETISSDIILSGADYHHTETFIGCQASVYSEEYWDSRVFAPSSLLFYVGFDKK